MRRYGDRITFDYYDIFADYAKVQKFPEIVSFLSKQPALPVVAFNGVPKFFGGISLKKISDILATMGLTPDE